MSTKHLASTVPGAKEACNERQSNYQQPCICLCLFHVYNGLLYMLYVIGAVQQPRQFYHHFIGEETGSKE